MVTALRWLLGACVLTLANSALAQSGRVELGWSAPEQCPDEQAVRQRIERILDRPLVAIEGEQLSVTAVVTAPSDSQPWTVTLETGSAKRTVQAASCDELANATALFVAILIEPNIDEPAPQAEPTTPPPSPPPTTASAPPELDRPTPPREKATSDWTIGAAIGARTGLVPSWTAGLGLYGAFSRNVIRLSGGASLWLPVQRSVNDEQGAEFQLSAAYGKACYRLFWSTLTPALCSGFELSVLRAEGFGPGVEPATRTAVFATYSFGSELFVRPSREVALILAADLLLPLGDRQFVFDGTDPAAIYSPAMGFQLSCGAEWSL